MSQLAENDSTITYGLPTFYVRKQDSIGHSCPIPKTANRFATGTWVTTTFIEKRLDLAQQKVTEDFEFTADEFPELAAIFDEAFAEVAAGKVELWP